MILLVYFIHLLYWNVLSTDHDSICQSQQFTKLKIPEINLSEFISGDDQNRLQIANQFDSGFNKYGIARIINHGIPSDLINEIFNEIANFFHDKDEIKMKYNLGNFGAPGYIPRNKESFYVDKVSGIKQTEPTESFHIVANYNNSYRMQSGFPYFPYKNDEGLPFHFTENILSLYYSKLRELLTNIHLIASIALGFNENIFESKMNENSFLGLRMTYYYQIETDLNRSEIGNNYHLRLSEHRDFAGFALIQNNKFNADGFQLLYKGEYFDIDYVENSILILGGDFIRFLTNNYWKSCLHRVLTKTKEERFTMIAFSGTDLEEIIDILPECIKCNSEQRKFKPINGNKWLLKRVHDANAMNDWDGA